MVAIASSIVLAVAAVLFSQASTDADVYSALLEIRYHAAPASKMVVKDVAIPMPTLAGSSAHWLEQFNDVPLDLRRAASRPQPTQLRPFDTALFPVGTRLVSERAIQEMFVGGIQESWDAFKRKFGTEGLVSFSEVLFTLDALDALVYYEAGCGGLCGEGGYIWLHRGSAQSRWSVRKKIIRVMS
jgi:hypothetical protein